MMPPTFSAEKTKKQLMFVSCLIVLHPDGDKLVGEPLFHYGPFLTAAGAEAAPTKLGQETSTWIHIASH